MLQTVNVTIAGLTPLLMNAYTGDEPEVRNYGKLTQADAWGVARAGAYFTGTTPMIPAPNFQQALIGGGKFCRGKGRANLSRIVAAALQTQEAEIPITAGEPELDRRMRKNPATGGRMLKYRLRIPVPWSAAFTLAWDDDLLMREQVRDVLTQTGTRVGLMDWRPEKRGAFGQFAVRSFGD